MKRLLSVVVVTLIGTGYSYSAGAVDVGVNIGIPTPVVVTPSPGVSLAPGWQGDRYYDGHRYWTRNEWEDHQRNVGSKGKERHGHRPVERHCPPGHAKKGQC